MGVNMYDQAAQMPIINTYVPINFGELYRIAATQKEEIDKANQALTTNLQKFGEFRSPSDIDTENYYKNSIGQFQDELNEIVNNPDAMKDAGFRARLNQKLNNLDYATLSRLKQGAENLKLRNSATAELKAKGLYNYNWDIYEDAAGNVKQFNASNYDTLSEGILDQLSPIQYKTLGEIVRPYVEGIKPTFYAGSVDPNTGKSLPYTKGYQAITKKELSNVLDKSYDEILATPQGKMWYRDIYNSMKLTNPEVTKEEAFEVFKDAVMRDASYKLISTPIDDEFAMKRALQREEYTMRLRMKQLEQKPPQTQLGIDDILSQQNSANIYGNVQAIRSGDNSFAQKYDNMYQNISDNITNLAEIAMQNPEFKQIFETALSDPRYNATTAIDLAFKMTNGLTDELKTSYINEKNQWQVAKNKEIDEATGKILQRTFNATLGNQDMNANPFTDIRTQLSDGTLYYDESLVHQMYEDGLYQISTKIGMQTQNELNSMLFGDNKRISTEIGYAFNPKGKLLSPKQYISNNNYITELAKNSSEDGFDIKNTKLNRGSISGDQDFDIEEKVTKGEFGNVAISDIIGYVDNNGERNYVVKVNIPLRQIVDKYDTWLSTESNIVERLDKTYQITSGIENESEDMPGKWKDGYITTTMLMPVSNNDLDATQLNRLWQKSIGTSNTKEAQILQDDMLLEKMKGYTPGFGLTR